MNKYLGLSIFGLATALNGSLEACIDKPVESVKFTTLDKRIYSQHNKEAKYHFYDKKSFESHYKEFHGGVTPIVDFSKEIVLGVYYGQKPTGGYSIEIKEIKEVGSSLAVILEKTNPDKNKFRIQVITSPYHLIKLKKTDKKIRWFEKK